MKLIRLAVVCLFSPFLLLATMAVTVSIMMLTPRDFNRKLKRDALKFLWWSVFFDVRMYIRRGFFVILNHEKCFK